MFLWHLPQGGATPWSDPESALNTPIAPPFRRERQSVGLPGIYMVVVQGENSPVRCETMTLSTHVN